MMSALLAECSTAPFFVFAGILFPLLAHTLALRFLNRITKGKERFGLTDSHRHNLSLKIARVSHISLLGGMLYFYVVSNLVAEGLEDGVLARQCEWANISMFVITFDIYELTQLRNSGHAARIFHHLLELGIVLSWVYSNVSPFIVFAGAQVVFGNLAFLVPVIMRVCPLSNKQLVIAAWACTIIALAPVVGCDIAIVYLLSTNFGSFSIGRKVTAVAFVIIFTGLDSMLLRNYFWPMIQKAKNGKLKSPLPMDNTYRMRRTSRKSVENFLASGDGPAVELMSATISKSSMNSYRTTSTLHRSDSIRRCPTTTSVRIPIRNDPLDDIATASTTAKKPFPPPLGAYDGSSRRLMSMSTVGSTDYMTSSVHDMEIDDSTYGHSDLNTTTFTREMQQTMRVRSPSGALPHQVTAHSERLSTMTGTLRSNNSVVIAHPTPPESANAPASPLSSSSPPASVAPSSPASTRSSRHRRLSDLRRSLAGASISPRSDLRQECSEERDVAPLPVHMFSSPQSSTSSPQQSSVVLTTAPFSQETMGYHGLMVLGPHMLGGVASNEFAKEDIEEPKAAPASPVLSAKDSVVSV